jgi:hypothetical protein
MSAKSEHRCGALIALIASMFLGQLVCAKLITKDFTNCFCSKDLAWYWYRHHDSPDLTSCNFEL